MKYLTPILILMGGGWLIRLENLLIKGSANHLFVTVTLALTLFGFGIALQPRRNNKTWVKKLLVSFVLLFFLLLDLGYLKVGIVSDLLYYGALDGVIYYMIYVFCGWLFFD
ncbi:MAG: hypothetical protein IKE59_01210 [Erysipelotrichaceae bacterium]|nr:hypothetical protein [Erysipelotrichaceae bacterium]